tara:strand:+ start:78 stop:254 length:177 start_codon:yes stop_codon:yes gene_type:complete
MNGPKYLVRFWSDELDTPQNVAEFWELDDAEGFCEEQNDGLARCGIPSSVANYSIIDL